MTAPFRKQLLRSALAYSCSSLCKVQTTMVPSLLLPGQPFVHALPSLCDVGAACGAFSGLQLRAKNTLARRTSRRGLQAAYNDGNSSRSESDGGRSAGGGFADRYSVSGGGGRSRGSDAGRGGSSGRGAPYRNRRGDDDDRPYDRGGGRGRGGRDWQGGRGGGGGGRGRGRGGRGSAGGSRYRDSSSTRYDRDTDSRRSGGGSDDWTGGSRYGDSSPSRYDRDADSRRGGGGDWDKGSSSGSRYRDGGFDRDDRRGGSRDADDYDRSPPSFQSSRGGRGVRPGRGTESAYSRGGEDGRHQGGTWDRADAEPGPLAALKASWRGDALYGVAPVLAALAGGRRTAHALYIQEGKEGGDQQAVQQATAAAEAADVPVEAAGKHELNMLCDNRPHQGLVLDCSPLDWEALERLPPADSFPPGAPPVWVALDEVQDPMNFGAVLRCAHFLGAAGVLACARNAAPLSPVVSKASAGALEAMTVFSASNLPKTLAAAREDGWLVLGASAEGSAVDVLDFQLDRPAILVIGSESAGLRTNVKRACSQLIRIGGGSTGGTGSSSGEGTMERWAVDSLNVSVASGILLHQLLAKARAGGSQLAADSSGNGAAAVADGPGGAHSDD